MKYFRYFKVKGKKEKFLLDAMSYSNKSDARKYAKYLRKQGHRVRIIKGLGYDYYGNDIYMKNMKYCIYKSRKQWFPNPYAK